MVFHLACALSSTHLQGTTYSMFHAIYSKVSQYISATVIKFEDWNLQFKDNILRHTSINTMPPKGGARQSTKVKAVSENDEQNTFTFPSLQAAAKALGIKSHSNINKALKSGRVINGYKFYASSTETSMTSIADTTQRNVVADRVNNIFGDAKIRHTVDEPILVSVFDIIRIVTDNANPRDTIAKLNPNLVDTFTYHKFSGAGERPTPVIELKDVMNFMKLLLVNTRLSLYQIKKWLKVLGCETEDIIQYRKSIIECDTIEIIEQAFSNFQCIKQHKVLQYYVDMYIPEFNICIECDENGHEHYDQQKEADRQASITVTLSKPEKPVKWVRFNPNSPEFSIGHVIHDINRYIFCRLKEATTQASQEQEQETQKFQCQLEIEKQHTLQLQAEVEKLQLIIASQGVSL